MLSVSFESTLTINGVTATSILSSTSAQDQLIASAAVPVDGLTPTVTILSVVTAPNELTVHLAADPGAQVKLFVEFTIPSAAEEISNSNSTNELYNGYKTQLSTSVSSGEFVQKLQSNGSSVYQSATVNSVEYSPVTVKTVSRFTATPTARPTEVAESSQTKISNAPSYEIGLIVGLLGGALALLAFVIYWYYSRRRSAFDAKIGPVTSEKVAPSSESFFDLERIKPNSTPRKKSADAARKAANIQNIHYDEAVEPAGAIPEINQYEMLDKVMFTRVDPVCEEDEADRPINATATELLQVQELLSMKK